MNKELLNNPEVKEIATEYAKKNMFNGVFGNNNLSNWDDFVKAQEPEKEWEVVTFVNGNMNVIYKRENGLFLNEIQPELNGVYTEQECLLNTRNKIHSVKRLSDGEVFTIGDIVNYGKITKFQVDGEMMLVSTEEGWSYDLGEIRSDRKPIFVTNDDVKVFEGDEYWYISPQWSVLSVKSANGFMHGAFAILSTEQAAKDWVVLNKPSLSPAELVSSGIINQGSPQYDKILKLAKSK